MTFLICPKALLRPGVAEILNLENNLKHNLKLIQYKIYAYQKPYRNVIFFFFYFSEEFSTSEHLRWTKEVPSKFSIFFCTNFRHCAIHSRLGNSLYLSLSFLDFLTFGDVADRFSRNVGTELPLYAFVISDKSAYLSFFNTFVLLRTLLAVKKFLT